MDHRSSLIINAPSRFSGLRARVRALGFSILVAASIISVAPAAAGDADPSVGGSPSGESPTDSRAGHATTDPWTGHPVADSTQDRNVTDPWAGHPALEPFALTGQDLPPQLFLVRTRGKLPDAAGVVVHGVRSGVFLVSGEPAAMMELAQRGCGVTALEPISSTHRSLTRTWLRLDTPDPAIAAMVAEVDSAGVIDKIQWLVDFGTRYSYAPNHFTVADAIGDVFASYGLTPILSSFVYGGATMWNVEAVQAGTVYPDSFFVICGHFDSYSGTPMIFAPGADDNGTGVAAVLTAAEILTPHDFEYSIRFICFGGEEQGLRGSQAYATWADQQNLGIVGVLNFDMMGYWEPGVEKDLEIETNHASQWLAEAIVNAANLYSSAPYELHVYDGAWWGDHASFWAKGYAAVNHEESWDWYDPDFNPYYHTTNDLLTYVGANFTVGNIQIGVAALATLAGLVPEGTGIDETITPPLFSGTLRAHPNPFYGRVTFTVTGLHDGAVRVLIFDALGRLVDVLPMFSKDGEGAAVWVVNDRAAREIGAGVYFGKVEGLPGTRPVKIVCIK